VVVGIECAIRSNGDILANHDFLNVRRELATRLDHRMRPDLYRATRTGKDGAVAEQGAIVVQLDIATSPVTEDGYTIIDENPFSQS
jgi:hypothetical protein